MGGPSVRLRDMRWFSLCKYTEIEYMRDSQNNYLHDKKTTYEEMKYMRDSHVKILLTKKWNTWEIHKIII